MPAERIQRLGEDNYWRMADVGPCGPCSEIFWDKGSEYGPGGGPAHGGEERFVEVWNLVFMQFESTPEGEEVPLPKPSIDTGLGLERTVAVLQGVDSVFQTDEFVALLDAAQRLTEAKLGESDARDVSLRILADHARSTSLLVSDGVFPSNEDRGYVLRRIVRRAVRHAYLLGVELPVMGGMVDAVVEVMGEAYPGPGPQPRLRARCDRPRGAALPPDAAHRAGHPRRANGRPRPRPADRRRCCLPASRHLRLPPSR